MRDDQVIMRHDHEKMVKASFAASYYSQINDYILRQSHMLGKSIQAGDWRESDIPTSEAPTFAESTMDAREKSALTAMAITPGFHVRHRLETDAYHERLVSRSGLKGASRLPDNPFARLNRRQEIALVKEVSKQLDSIELGINNLMECSKDAVDNVNNALDAMNKSYKDSMSYLTGLILQLLFGSITTVIGSVVSTSIKPHIEADIGLTKDSSVRIKRESDIRVGLTSLGLKTAGKVVVDKPISAVVNHFQKHNVSPINRQGQFNKAKMIQSKTAIQKLCRGFKDILNEHLQNLNFDGHRSSFQSLLYKATAHDTELNAALAINAIRNIPTSVLELLNNVGHKDGRYEQYRDDLERMLWATFILNFNQSTWLKTMKSGMRWIGRQPVNAVNFGVQALVYCCGFVAGSIAGAGYGAIKGAGRVGYGLLVEGAGGYGGGRKHAPKTIAKGIGTAVAAPLVGGAYGGAKLLKSFKEMSFGSWVKNTYGVTKYKSHTACIVSGVCLSWTSQVAMINRLKALKVVRRRYAASLRGTHINVTQLTDGQRVSPASDKAVTDVVRVHQTTVRTEQIADDKYAITIGRFSLTEKQCYRLDEWAYTYTRAFLREYGGESFFLLEQDQRQLARLSEALRREAYIPKPSKKERLL